MAPAVEIVPSPTNRTMSARCCGFTLDSSSSIPASLSSPARSVVIQFAALFGSAPRPTASSKKPAQPAEASCAATCGPSPCSSARRARLAAGSSGSSARSRSIHSSPGSTGARSGSGKYR